MNTSGERRVGGVATRAAIEVVVGAWAVSWPWWRGLPGAPLENVLLVAIIALGVGLLSLAVRQCRRLWSSRDGSGLLVAGVVAAFLAVLPLGANGYELGWPSLLPTAYVVFLIAVSHRARLGAVPG